MEIINRSHVEFVNDTCGKIQELYTSDSLSIAYVIVTGRARSHKHNVMEEVYYVEKGRGNLFVEKTCHEIIPGDVIPIPKDKFHHLEKTSEEPLEVLVITSPKYDLADVIEE